MNDPIVVTRPEDIQKIVSEAVREAVTGILPVSKTQEKEVYSNRDAMKFLGVSRSTLQRWREDKILSYRKINGTIMYTKSDLIKILDDNRCAK